MSKRLTIFCIVALTLLFVVIISWLRFDEPMGWGASVTLIMMFAGLAIGELYRPGGGNQGMALGMALITVIGAALMLAETLLHLTESGRAWMLRIAAAIVS